MYIFPNTYSTSDYTFSDLSNLQRCWKKMDLQPIPEFRTVAEPPWLCEQNVDTWQPTVTYNHTCAPIPLTTYLSTLSALHLWGGKQPSTTQPWDCLQCPGKPQHSSLVPTAVALATLRS